MTAEEYLDAIEQVKELARLRAELHLWRKTVSDAIGVHSQSLKRWEEGRGTPLPAFQKRVAVTLETLREAVRRRCEVELLKSKPKPWRRMTRA